MGRGCSPGDSLLLTLVHGNAFVVNHPLRTWPTKAVRRPKQSEHVRLSASREVVKECACQRLRFPSPSSNPGEASLPVPIKGFDFVYSKAFPRAHA